MNKDSRIIIGIGEEKEININGISFYLKKNCYGLHNSAHAYSMNKTVEYGVELEN